MKKTGCYNLDASIIVIVKLSCKNIQRGYKLLTSSLDYVLSMVKPFLHAVWCQGHIFTFRYAMYVWQAIGHSKP